MNTSFASAFNTLNENQKSAVEALEGPVLVSAGAGSGKTRVLTCRIAHLIHKNKAKFNEILAVTFTNKAAREMQNRVENLLHHLQKPSYEKMWISTFHSVCARILKENKNQYLPGPAFTIYDSRDQLSLVKKVMKDLNMSEQTHNSKSLAQQIALCKREALGPEDIDSNAHFPVYSPQFQKFYFQYEKELKSAGAFDFESLLFETYKLFLKHPAFLEKYRQKFKYISVDEYQDTNHIQYLIIKLLAEKHRNICVVGDEDQSIYSWRGANISNILNFDKDFPECKIIKLEKNYRSTKKIISSAGALISRNNLRKNKKLFTDNMEGKPVSVYEFEDEYAEGRFIAGCIKESCENQGFSFKDFAVFYRTNAQSRVLEDSLRSLGLAYNIVGSLKFYDRAEIKDILAYFKFILNSQDEISLKRIINTPKRGVGQGTVDKIHHHARQFNKSFYKALTSMLEQNFFTGQLAKNLYTFTTKMEDLRKHQPNMPILDFYHQVLSASGYMEVLKKENSIESMSRIDNLQEFGSVIAQFEKEQEQNSLEQFLEEMSLSSPEDSADSDKDAVTLMTLHISKGLEFDTVFISGMEEGLFPLFQNIDAENIEEERRLAYVGMTRAQKNLFLSYAKNRHKFGKIRFNQASRFLKELPDNDTVFTSFAKKSAKKIFSRKARPSYSSEYEVGRPVHHPHFGPGRIQKVEGSGEDLKISVQFKNNTIKKFIARYARFSI